MRKRINTRKALVGLWVAAILVTLAAYANKGDFVDYSEIRPELLDAPRQSSTKQSPFSFAYERNRYNVKPVAEYELHGLVVSHNDIHSITDLWHDDTSVDTKDIAVIWGGNLKTNDFHRVHFENTAFWVHWRYPAGVQFNHSEIANNHLITDGEAARETIGRVRVGDQVRVVGMLADYEDARNPGHWRRSSTSRADEGDGACEVLFVREIEILERATPVWYFLYAAGGWMIVLIPLAIAAHFIIETHVLARRNRLAQDA